jgi:MYND finger
MRALVTAGADLDLSDINGDTTCRMLKGIPVLLKTVTEASRERDIAASKCDACDTAGARMRCMRCRSVFYCDAAFQRAGWRQHRKECADFSKGDVVDVDTKTMLTNEVAPGLGRDTVFQSFLTGKTSVGTLQPSPKDPEVFVVKVQRAFTAKEFGSVLPGVDDLPSSEVGAVRISNKANSHILLGHKGPGHATHVKLWNLVKSGGTTSCE